MINPPTSFVSYSWDSKAHKRWVLDLAIRLRQDGVDVTLDQWHAVPGDKLPYFMEKAVDSNDFVLIICTPNYKKKSDERRGGVGYEGDIITAKMLSGVSDRKFIPILREGSWDEAAPTWLIGNFYIDLSAEPYDEENYKILLSTLLGLRPEPPQIGKIPPSFADTYLGQEPSKPECLEEVLDARKNFNVEVLRFDASQEIGTEFPYSDYVRLRITNNSEYILPFLTVQTTRFNRSGRRIGSSRAPSINTSNVRPGESFEVDYYPRGHLPGVEQIIVEIEHLINKDSMQFFKEFEPFVGDVD